MKVKKFLANFSNIYNIVLCTIVILSTLCTMICLFCGVNLTIEYSDPLSHILNMSLTSQKEIIILIVTVVLILICFLLPIIFSIFTIKAISRSQNKFFIVLTSFNIIFSLIFSVIFFLFKYFNPATGIITYIAYPGLSFCLFDSFVLFLSLVSTTTQKENKQVETKLAEKLSKKEIFVEAPTSKEINSTTIKKTITKETRQTKTVYGISKKRLQKEKLKKYLAQLEKYPNLSTGKKFKYLYDKKLISRYQLLELEKKYMKQKKQ